jgi:hypothetical protein
VDVAGRYRLDLVDQNNKAIASAPSGYVQVNAASLALVDAPAAPVQAYGDNVAIEAMRINAEMSRINAELSRTVVEKFPHMMDAASNLLRAADGAGIPAREPFVRFDDDEDDDDDEDAEAAPAPSASDAKGIIAQLLEFVPAIAAGLTSGAIKVPDLGSLFDWRKASKLAAAAAKAETPTAPEPTKAASPFPTLTPKDMVHVMAVQNALEPNEVALVREVMKELGPQELLGWLDELRKLSVPDAVAKIRTLTSTNGKTGGAS